MPYLQHLHNASSNNSGGNSMGAPENNNLEGVIDQEDTKDPLSSSGV